MKKCSIAILIVIAVVLSLTGLAYAADTQGSVTPEVPGWIVYLIGVLANIGIVTLIKNWAVKRNITWLADSGRVTNALVFLICFVFQLFSGRTGDLRHLDTFIALIEQTSLMAFAAIGLHTAGKSLKQLGTAANYIIAILLVIGVCAIPSHGQVTTQEIVIPQVRSITTTPITITEKSFTATVFFDKHDYALAPIGTELWRSGKLHASMFALVKPDDDLQIAGNVATGYDIDVSKPFRAILKKPTLMVTVTPYWSFTQTITGDKIGKPFPGVSITIKP